MVIVSTREWAEPGVTGAVYQQEEIPEVIFFQLGDKKEDLSALQP